MKSDESFLIEYKRLNTAQKRAVDTIEGPVMVIAGPGTGKTQVLALRIANILIKTDTQADGILCLTFTNSGVHAMRERLRTYIGPAASRVRISTFHSFAIGMIEEFYSMLGYVEKPELIDELSAIALSDEVLEQNHFEHIRSRANKALYFREIKSLVSLLKRERMSPEDFLVEIKKEITSIEEDESNISSRGASKGSLKQDALRKIESLLRTEEIVMFYEKYEALKRERNVLDYDDALVELVRLVGVSDEVRATIAERYLYVLVDEHQDSSGVQNEFLARVWGEVERPNVFVVGDDRQLIYGFGGASLSHFEQFRQTFSGTEVVVLSDNYRSTQTILDTADTLLQSSLVESALKSHHNEKHALRLVEAEYARDEIIRAGLEIKKYIADAEGGEQSRTRANECAILVPKNTQVKNAMRILRDLGLPVAGGGAMKLFEMPDAESLLAILRACAAPEVPHLVAPLLLDPLSRIPAMDAHRFLASSDTRKLTLSKLIESGDESIAIYAEKLRIWLGHAQTLDVYGLIQKIGDEFLVANADNHEIIATRIEIIRSFLHLALSQMERNPHLTLSEFLSFIDRLREYGSDIPLAVFGADEGVRVMTLHGSKGLEFDFVWIAHMDEKNLARRGGGGFVLPATLAARVEERDEAVIKRELYVAITRAKRFCTLSYSLLSYTGGTQELAHVVADLGATHFEKVSAVETEAFIRRQDQSLFVVSNVVQPDPVTQSKLVDLVRNEYAKHKVSVTHLNNFYECSWKWYFRNFLCLPESKTISLEFGNVVHSVIEQLLRGKISSNEKSLATAIEAQLEKVHGLPSVELSRMRRDARSVLTRWSNDRLPVIADIHESEKNLSYRDPDFDHLAITGKIDLVEQLGEGSVRVTDFKTGSVKKKSDIERESEEGRLSEYYRQLVMYAYLIDRSSGGNLHATESRLEFIEAKAGDKDAMYTTLITPDAISKLRRDISDFDQSILSGDWTDRPCQFKPWKGTDECDYCALAKKIYLKY